MLFAKNEKHSDGMGAGKIIADMAQGASRQKAFAVFDQTNERDRSAGGQLNLRMDFSQILIGGDIERHGHFFQQTPGGGKPERGEGLTSVGGLHFISGTLLSGGIDFRHQKNRGEDHSTDEGSANQNQRPLPVF